jgi:hypothetical protein
MIAQGFALGMSESQKLKALKGRNNMYLRKFIFHTFFLIAIISCSNDTLTMSSRSLEEGFISPPREARPNVMWWWLNSNISKDGITRDLEEMKQQGIGGALIFDAAPVDRWRPKNVEPAPIGPPFISDQWRELFRHAIKEADRLDLELGVSLTSGFNAGGPWVTPEYGQQELVWSETIITGSADSSIKLPLPSGPIYGNKGELLSYNEMKVNNDLEYDQSGQPIHYRDIAILAFPFPNTFKNQKSGKSPDPPSNRLKNWALKSVHSFDYPENKGFVFDVVYDMIDEIAGELTLPLETIIDLTSRLDEDGNLNWSAPTGKWLILRFGHTHTGIRLQATNPQNKGLAMNHLSANAASKHFEQIGKKMVEDISSVEGQSLKYFYLDSWEVRIANWTEGFRNEFRSRRGYDMTLYLPVLAGYIIDNRKISNRFLHDYRLTIGDCIADNYYGHFQKLSHQNGRAYHAEMATTPIPVDMLKCLGRTDVPFGEFWTETDLGKGRIEPWQRMFGKQAASAAHIYGKRFAAAEALTVIQKHWEHSPFQLKRTTDQAFCSGLNKLMIHTFTHSPPGVRPPGYEYFAGTHFNPNITWWEQAHAFTKYISRCQFLLQQGHFTADVCFYQGDQIPSFVPKKQIYPGLGYGYDYDVINSEVILERLSVSNGQFVLPDGMRYRLLILPESEMINLQVLKKIEKLVLAGGTVIGTKPNKAYGLKDYPQNDSIVSDITDRIWGGCDGEIIKEGQYGKGRIIWGKTPREVLLSDGIPPDFEYKGRSKESKIDFIHRSLQIQTEKIEVYFVANFKDNWEELECTFRITDKVPEIWNPETGETRDLFVYIDNNGRITCPLSLPPHGSVFVVFRKNQKNNYITGMSKDAVSLFPSKNNHAKSNIQLEIERLDENRIQLKTSESGQYKLNFYNNKKIDIGINKMPDPLVIKNRWTVHFPAEWGAPDSITMTDLKSWTEFPVSGIKYFSGTAEYHTTIDLPDTLMKSTYDYDLDLGIVKDIAEITINDQGFPVQWKKPYRINITPYLKSGINHLTIKITNLWPNRLIGDQFLPVEERLAFTNIGKFTRNSALLESGLIGPVRIVVSHKSRVEF